MLRPLRVVGAVGAMLRLFSLAFLLPLVVAFVYEPYDTAVGPLRMPFNALTFMLAATATYLLGTSMRIVARSVDEEDLREREAYLTVGLGWIVVVLVAMLPFIVGGVLVHPVEAFFETMSGMTTTGATVIVDLEGVPPSIMMWRGQLQFIGGMGIIVLSVAVLARLTQGGMQMLQAEAPGPTVTRIAPRLAQTARILWTVYALFASVLFVLLCLLLMRHDMAPRQIVYEALLHTFTTMATGGFSNHSTSISHFDDAWLEGVLVFFILLSGTNYTLHYHWLQGRWRNLLKDPEWRFYLSTFAVTTLAIAAFLWRDGTGPMAALRGAGFTVASFITSTGFTTADYDQWPAVTKFLLLLIMVTGATAGSTSGGMKHVRILLLWKLVAREIDRIRHPHAVLPVRLGGRAIQPATIMATVGFFFAFVAIWVAGTIFLVATDPAFTDVVDAASASISAISNMGPGLGVVGPTQNYAGLTAGSKFVLSLLMWAGRLEIFTALIVFTPSTWRN